MSALAGSHGQHRITSTFLSCAAVGSNQGVQNNSSVQIQWSHIIIEKTIRVRVSMAYRMMYEGIRMLADRTRQAFAGLRAVVRVIPL